MNKCYCGREFSENRFYSLMGHTVVTIACPDCELETQYCIGGDDLPAENEKFRGPAYRALRKLARESRV